MRSLPQNQSQLCTTNTVTQAYHLYIGPHGGHLRQTLARYKVQLQPHKRNKPHNYFLSLLYKSHSPVTICFHANFKSSSLNKVGMFMVQHHTGIGHKWEWKEADTL
jgi:hypothetical protein